MPGRLDRLKKRLVAWFRSPGAELSRKQRTARYLLDLSRHCWRELQRDRAVQLSAALAYRTVFSIVPLLVVGLVLFKAFGSIDDASQLLRDQVFSYLALDEKELEEALVDEADKSVFPEPDGPVSADTPNSADGAEPIDATDPPEAIDTDEHADPADDVAEAAPRRVRGEGFPLFAFASDRRAEAEAVPAESDAAPQPADTLDTIDEMAEVREKLDLLFDSLTDRLDRVSFGSIGVIGILLLMWSALRLIVTVEQGFNQVVKADEQRSWAARVVVYWFALTLGVVLLAVSLQTIEVALNRLKDLPKVGHIAVAIGGRVVSVASTMLLLFFLYRNLPTRRLQYRPLLIGAFVAAVLWELWKIAFRLYLTTTFSGGTSTSVLYGSLALVPVFLLWVQMTWLIVLFGLSMSYALHTMPNRRLKDTGTAAQRAGLVDPRWVLPVLAVIAEQFDQGKTIQAERLAARVSLPPQSVSRLLHGLQEAHLVHHVQRLREEQDDPGFTLAKPAHKTPAAEVLDYVHRLSDNANVSDHVPGVKWMRGLHTTERAAAQDYTLADLLGDGENDDT